MACFSIVPMEKQALNFPKIVHDHAVKFELSLRHSKFLWQ